jgi:hypothetical protein
MSTFHASTVVHAAWYQTCKALMPPCDPPTAADLSLKARLLGSKQVCVYCGDATTGQDHFRPVVGPDSLPTGYCEDIWNMVTCCPTCNSSKGNRHWREFMNSSTPRSPKGRGCTGVSKKIQRLEKFAAAGSTRAQRWNKSSLSNVLSKLRAALQASTVRHAAQISLLNKRVKRVALQPQLLQLKIGCLFNSRLAAQVVHSSLSSMFACSPKGVCQSLCLYSCPEYVVHNDTGRTFKITIATNRKYANILMKSQVKNNGIHVLRSAKLESSHAPAKGYQYGGVYTITKHVKQRTELSSAFTFTLTRTKTQ